MKGVSKTILVGSMGADPEVRYTPHGDCVATFSVATNKRWTDKATGQKQEHTEWHRCVTFKRLAEIVRDYGKKGQTVYVEGENRTKKWTDQQGVDHYPTTIHVNEFNILYDPTYKEGQQQAPQQAPQPSPQAPQQPQNNDSRMNPNGTQKSPYAAPHMDSFDDDIPF